MKRISFIVPAFNCQDTLEESVKSIFLGNISGGDEIIIIDDASTDRTLKVVRLLMNKHPQIRLVRHKYNKGTAAAARNTGIEASKNDLIFCLDSDNVLEKSSIDKLKTYLIKQNADAAAFGEIHYFIDSIKNVKTKWKLVNRVSLNNAINTPTKTPCGSGNYLYTKSSWLKSGRYNEGIGGAHDSLAFAYYQILNGFKMVTLSNTHYFHRFGYNSTYVNESKKCNTSLRVLQILMPYLHLFEEKDVEKIFSKEYRYRWFDDIIENKFRLNIKQTPRLLIYKQRLKKIIKGFIAHQ